MQDDSQNRRRYRRVAVDLPVRISTIDPETDPHTGRPCFRASREVCRNLSRGGLFVRTLDPLAPGRRVLLEVELPGGRGFEAVGRVAWCRVGDVRENPVTDVGVGIQFLGGSLDQLARLEQFLTTSDSAGN
jgi:uncharacterized protein (TIGR02266 family)